ncbi:hypothetical protein [Bacillus sp. T33-2]|uniref:hypothetical protein n=1 Tax=Bacillus sp. T33-2 TaxID=2054168 RepID=UPI000C76324E|nr:hypothetical protein [Bacillus sp. T33-2]PLR98191.1 hypothetical protein CVD19_06245 [Bacillus sp. T33-2]
MGQLIKLQDYVSRYEQDIYHYPSRFVRLKKKQWEGLKENWEKGPSTPVHAEVPEMTGEIKQTAFKRFGNLFARKQNDVEEMGFEPDFSGEEKDDFNIGDSVAVPYSIRSTELLKQHFLDSILPFQIKWASSTLTEQSYVDRAFYHDERLKFLLQRFPDTFLILYKPIFLLKKAPVEGETIVMTPTGAWCIHFIDARENDVFAASKGRFWEKRNPGGQSVKVLNPVLGLNRTEKIISTLFKLHEVELPINKAVICRNGYVDFPSPPYDIQLIEKRNYEEWFQSMRGLKSPLKAAQLKGAQALLDYCQTTRFKRVEWSNAGENVNED